VSWRSSHHTISSYCFLPEPSALSSITGSARSLDFLVPGDGTAISGWGKPKEEPKGKYTAKIGPTSGNLVMLHRNWRASGLRTARKAQAHLVWPHLSSVLSTNLSLPSLLDRSTARSQVSCFLMAPEWSIHLANHQSFRSAGVRETSKYDSHFGEASARYY